MYIRSVHVHYVRQLTERRVPDKRVTQFPITYEYPPTASLIAQPSARLDRK